jgi:predicted metallo-beta-lactamase superfamily hydrolase
MPLGSSSSAFGVRSTATTVNLAPASSVAVALQSSLAPTTTATLLPAPPNEAMMISQPFDL